jgi:hypothetical protein
MYCTFSVDGLAVGSAELANMALGQIGFEMCV